MVIAVPDLGDDGPFATFLGISLLQHMMRGVKRGSNVCGRVGYRIDGSRIPLTHCKTEQNGTARSGYDGETVGVKQTGTFIPQAERRKSADRGTAFVQS